MSTIGISTHLKIEKTEYDFLKVNKIYFNWGEQSNAITLWNHKTEKALITPEYNKAFGINNAAAYIKGSNITIKVKFISESISNAIIKAIGTFGGFSAQNVTFQNDESEWIYFTCNEFPPFEIRNQSVSWSWLLYNTSTTNWDLFDKTNHTIYLLNKEPCISRVWEKLADWTTKWCIGLTDDMDVVDSIFNGFIKDKFIKYGFNQQKNVAEVLREGNGLCGDLSELFNSACGTQGVKIINFGFIVISRFVDSQYLWNFMLITNPGLGREQLPIDFEIDGLVVNSTYPYPKYYGPSSENDDVDEYIFRAWRWSDHAINLFEYNGIIYLYDLSYGKKYENVFDLIPNNGTINSSEVPLFRKNYFDKAIDFLHGWVFYIDDNGNKNKKESLDIKASIIPDVVNNENQIMFNFFKFNNIGDYTITVRKTKAAYNPLFSYFLGKFPLIKKLSEIFLLRNV